MPRITNGQAPGAEASNVPELSNSDSNAASHNSQTVLIGVPENPDIKPNSTTTNNIPVPAQISPSPYRQFLITEVILRALAAGFALISFSLLGSDSKTIQVTNDYGAAVTLTIKFSDLNSLKYALAASVVSFVYCLVQVIVAGYHLLAPGQAGSLSALFRNFWVVLLDQVCSGLLLSGSAAGFAASDVFEKAANLFGLSGFDDFLGLVNAASGMAVVAFCCASASAVMCSHRVFTLGTSQPAAIQQ